LAAKTIDISPICCYIGLILNGGYIMLRGGIAPEPKKYKYILNGEVLYFTREELKAREREINEKNNIYFPDKQQENDVGRLIE
jgi:hypothetical protein